MYPFKIGLSSVFAIIVLANMSSAWVRFREPLSRRNFLNQTLIEKLQNCAGREETDCGLCGEGPGEVQTHGIPTENYTVIDPDVRVLAVELGFRSGLNGYLEFRVCNVTDNSTLDAITCNATTPLLIGSDEQWYPSRNQTSAKSRFRLPRGLLCERCVLQVKYTPGPNSTMKDFRFYDCALLNISHPTKVITNTVITTRIIHHKKVFPQDLQITESRQGSTELRSANTHQINGQNVLRSMNRSVTIDRIHSGNNQINADMDNKRSAAASMDTSININTNRQGNNLLNVNNNQGVMRSVHTSVNIGANREGINQLNSASNKSGSRSMNKTVNIVRTINTARNANQGHQKNDAFNSDTHLGKEGIAEEENAKTVLINTKFYNFSTIDNNAASAQPGLARITTIDIKGNMKTSTVNDKILSNSLSQTNLVKTAEMESGSNLISNVNTNGVISNTGSPIVSNATSRTEKHSFKIHGVNLSKKKVTDITKNSNVLTETTNEANNIDFVKTNTNLISDREVANAVSRVDANNVQKNDTIATDISNSIGTIQGETTVDAKEATNNNESLGYYDYSYYYYNDTASGNDTYIYYEDTVNSYGDTRASASANLSESLIDARNVKDITVESKTIGMAEARTRNSQFSDQDLSMGTGISSGVSNVDISNSVNNLSTFSDQKYQENQILQNSENRDITNNNDIAALNADTTLTVNNRVTELNIPDLSGSQDATEFSKTTTLVNNESLDNKTFETRETSGFANEITFINNATPQLNTTYKISDLYQNRTSVSNITTSVDMIKDNDPQNLTQKIVFVPNTIVVLPERNDTKQLNKNAVYDSIGQTGQSMDVVNLRQHARNTSDRSELSSIDVSNTYRSDLSAQANTVNDSRINAFDKSVGWNDFLIDESQIVRKDNLMNEIYVSNAVSSDENVLKANSVTDSTTNIYPYDVSTDTSFNEATKRLHYAISAANRKPQYALANEIMSSDLINKNEHDSSSSVDSSILKNNDTQFQNKGWNRIKIISKKADPSLVADSSTSLIRTRSGVTTGVDNVDITNSNNDLSAFPELINENGREITNVETYNANEITLTNNVRNNESVYTENLISPVISTSRNTEKVVTDISTQTQSETEPNINIILDSNTQTDIFDVSSSSSRHQTMSGIERSAFPGRVFAKIPDLKATRPVTMEKVTTPKQNVIIAHNEIKNQNDNSLNIMKSFTGITDLENKSFSVLDKVSTTLTNAITDSSTDTKSIHNEIVTTSSSNVQLDISTRPYDNYLGISSTTADPFEKAGKTFVRMINYSEITSDSVFPAPKLDVSSISDITGERQTNTESVLMSLFTSTPLPRVISEKSQESSPDVTNSVYSSFENSPSFSNLNFFADSETRVDRLGGVPVLTSQDGKEISNQTSKSKHYAIRDETSGSGYFDMTNTLIYNSQLDNEYINANSNSKIIGLAVPLVNSKLDSDTQVFSINSHSNSSAVRQSASNMTPSDKVIYQGGKTIVWQSMQLSNISHLNDNKKIGNNVSLLPGSTVYSNDSSNFMLYSDRVDSKRINSKRQNEVSGFTPFESTNTSHPQINDKEIAPATIGNTRLNEGNLQESKNIRRGSNITQVASWEQDISKILNNRISNNEHVSKTRNLLDTSLAENTDVNKMTISGKNVVSASSEIIPQVVSSSTAGGRVTSPVDTTVRSAKNDIIDKSGIVGITTINNANTKLVTTRNEDVPKEIIIASPNILDISMNGNAQINKIKNINQEKLPTVNNNMPLVEMVLKSTKVENLGISINGNANKNNILAAKDKKLKTEKIRGTVPVVMPPIEVKSSARGAINKVTYLSGQDQENLLTRQVSLTPKTNITLFNPYLKTNEYNRNVQKRPFDNTNENVGNSVYKILSDKIGRETSTSNLSMSTLWDINRGNNDADKETVVNSNNLLVNNANSDIIYRGIDNNRQINLQTFDNSQTFHTRNDIQSTTRRSNGEQNDVNQKVLRTLEALFLELGAIDSKNGHMNTQTSSVYQDKANDFGGSYPLFRVHENLLTVPTVIREWNGYQEYTGGQRGSQNHRLLNNLAVTNERDWNNAFKLNTNINVENSSDIRNSGQSVIDMSNLQIGNANLFSRLSGAFANNSRLGRRDQNSIKDVQSSKIIKAIASQDNIVINGIINDIDSVQSTESSQSAKPVIRKQAIIKSLGSTFFNPFTGENITLPGRGKHFSDTFIARGIGNIRHMKGIEQLYPANLSGSLTNEKYTYTPGNDSGKVISIEGKYMKGQMKLNDMGQFEPVPLASKFDTNKAEMAIANMTLSQYTNDTDTKYNKIDDNMSLKASILSRLFSRNVDNVNKATSETVNLPSPIASDLLKSDITTNNMGTIRSSSVDSIQISNEGITTGNVDPVEVQLTENIHVKNELLKESSSKDTNTEQIPEINKFPRTNELETYTINLFDVNSMKKNSKSSVINKNNYLQTNFLNMQNDISQTRNILSPDKYFFSQNELLNGIALNPTNMPSMLTESSPIVTSNIIKESFIDKGTKCAENELFICNAVGKNREVPGMVWWCFSHCQNGVCPPEKCACRCEKPNRLQRNDNANVREKVSGKRRREKVIQLTLNNPEVSTATVTLSGENSLNELPGVQVNATSVSANRNDNSDNIIKGSSSVAPIIESGNVNIVNSANSIFDAPLKCKGINAFKDTTGIDELCTKMCAQNICPDEICRCS